MARRSQMAGTMTRAQFRRVAAQFPAMTDRAKAIAARVLVDGESPIDVASAEGLSRQMIDLWASKLFRAAVPAGWVTVTLVLPPELVDEARALEARARDVLVPVDPG